MRGALIEKLLVCLITAALAAYASDAILDTSFLSDAAAVVQEWNDSIQAQTQQLEEIEAEIEQ